MRKIGIEEEMLLVDPATGRTTAVSERAVRRHDGDAEIEHELFLEQIETMTEPHALLADLAANLEEVRRQSVAAARSAGASLIASGTPPLLSGELSVTPKPRYERMIEEAGEIGRYAVVCGMHVHVDVDGDDEAVGVMDRIQPWLPIILAISANSPYSDGRETEYASWRSRSWTAWPTAGPVEPFGDPATYHRAVSELIASGAALDEGMIYFDARIARSLPTIEVRVADVCTDLRDGVLVAALVRALVETEARAWAEDRPTDPWRVELLRGARWQAARHGTAERLFDPGTRQLLPAGDVLANLVSHVAEALADAGDTDLVHEGLERIAQSGTGADHQRRIGVDGDLVAVVADLALRTDPDA
ncbi:YbdK family carboxylate-amine ligase [Mumia zhuanghuii]|uniref:Putative glutamate--cysteine ligase 2 n=2 Tax=Mumia TaxID=1546255 RepID=A0ABW1QGE8_9ACTN|nr:MULTISPECIES: glutamate--cysteine ligase [Mumia]KAA1424818.1 YbdK family carboxylate-amine ligase [Mumia zhuanghuii]